MQNIQYLAKFVYIRAEAFRDLWVSIDTYEFRLAIENLTNYNSLP